MPLPSSVKIVQITAVTEDLYQACLKLVPQLTSNNPPPRRTELASMLTEGTSILFIALEHKDEGNEIIGLATLALYHVPTGRRAIIEDVVVDEKARGRGIGEALTRICLERAEQAGYQQVMLTSNSRREAANRLYRCMGFELRKTNVYRYSFKQGK